MPVDSKHPEYQKNINAWSKIRDVVAGESAVKRKSQVYLPILSGQDIDEYDAYLTRAQFYPATTRTVAGLVGAVFTKEPQIDVPESMQSFIDNIDLRGQPLTPFSKAIVEDVVTLARAGILVDADDVGTPYLAHYSAESIVNWRETVEDGKPRLTMVVLEESVMVQGDDAFEQEQIKQYRVLTLGAMVDTSSGVGVYAQAIFREQPDTNGSTSSLQQIGEPTVPTRRGEALDFIPFVFVSTTDLKPSVKAAPLLPLADVNLSHYRTLADLEHGAHFTALPTIVIVGNIASEDEDSKGSPIKIGPEGIIHLDDGGDAKMLEYTGGGLSALEARRESKEQQMAVLGARMLEEQKAGVESAAAIGLRHRGENSILASLADTCSRGITQALNWLAWWATQSDDPNAEIISFELNTDFLPFAMSGQDVVAMVTGWNNGGFGLEVLYDILQKGERLPEGMTYEAYLADIEENGPGGVFVGDLSLDSEGDSNGAV
jgi:hypothetical protein